MNKKDLWSVHLEYLKVAITLATGILALSAVMYSDISKLPTDCSKYVLLGCCAFLVCTLIASLMAMASLSNWMVTPESTSADSIDDKKKKNKITIRSGASFLFLAISAICLLVFFAMRTLTSTMAAQQAIDISSAFAQKRIDHPRETVTLRKLEMIDQKYDVTYLVGSGPKTIVITLDAKTNQLLSLLVKD